ncbi:TonB family protein [Opitutus sp. ER46]|uniref:TonB family protein n=1 Tax=Opitutus sp. ER46 TaxID=2161864 RepID=UPI000D30D704|nr:TonB family protein [Opitutus sp. ER46]PTX95475.1 hypothetical protein DB354_08595 [Opitutus sp. ER46]
MKSPIPTLSLLALALAVLPVSAQVPASAPNFVPLRVTSTELPVFPHDLIQLGVREGEVRIAFSVGTDGKLEDCLAVAYTHSEFARVTMGALRRWKFEAARYRGQPIATATEVSVVFQVEGTVVVSLTPSETLNVRLFSILEGKEPYRPRALKELDRIPTPIAAPSPGIPENFAKATLARSVTVSFYIDEDGKVRLPSVDSTEDAELGAAAIMAMRDWKFEPPTCRGRRVLVRASQVFNFRPPTPAPAATASNG